MASEPIVEDALARSQRFKALYDDPTMRELLEGTLGDLYRQWLTSEPDDHAKRERLYQTALAVRSLKARIDTERGPADMKAAQERQIRDEAQRVAREGDGGAA